LHPDMKGIVQDAFQPERQITHQTHGHMLTNTGVWSPDGQWIVYDVRASDSVFDGTRIECVHCQSGEKRLLYESHHGAACGVVTFHPQKNQIVFIHGPEHPDAEWSYGACHRRGVLVDCDKPGVARNLDACDIVPPFTVGALRGGSHVHVFSGDGQWVSFTYEDHVLAPFDTETPAQDMNLRTIGVSVPDRSVPVSRRHPRNHDGAFFSVLPVRVTAHPRPGSDEINRACEEGWVGTNGYRKTDGTWQNKALAFQGHVVTSKGQTISEVFLVDLPENMTRSGEGPLEGTSTRRPFPPLGAAQRRLTFTEERLYPGLQGPRHWLRSAPDGSRIGFLMKDNAGIVQLWTVSPNGGASVQVTHLPWSISSAFSWRPGGTAVAFVADQSVMEVTVKTGRCIRLTPRVSEGRGPLPFACFYSPDGERIAFMRPVSMDGKVWNQIFCVSSERG
jgi:hypothetical protein